MTIPRFVLPQPRLPTPAIDALDREFVALERWDNSNLNAMCYIRASMSNVLQKQHEEHETARQIMDNLEEMFGEQTIQVKNDAIKGLMNCKQMGLRSMLQLNWSWFFKPCPRIFDLFQASYNLNQKEMSLTELMKELEAFEKIFKGSGSKAEANVAEPGSPARNPKRKKEKGKNKGNKPAAKAPVPKKSTKTKKRNVDSKKAKCFFYGRRNILRMIAETT
ncbi:hypothetical protein TIFTF001_016742 [Ficus carica]|uniref:Uncharacterized protein n=1 Tax=Ficus carica TaxID=3494 RepID=A0AA88A9B6_FICCA|nr:hypothetical protein TIFTF001_016742 [Ficus carica]